jgi:pyruvate/2-oxoglutarate dehydrogenase complex dihydrolipoamide acyltransferase (E2) component
MRAALTALPGLSLLAAALCALCALCAPCGAATPQRLRDPFERPAAPAPAPRVAAADGTHADAAAATATDAAPPWKPELRAILYDQARSLVNISGVVLAIGESVRGYRLASIDERSATLVKGGASIRLTLDKKERAQ